MVVEILATKFSWLITLRFQWLFSFLFMICFKVSRTSVPQSLEETLVFQMQGVWISDEGPSWFFGLVIEDYFRFLWVLEIHFLSVCALVALYKWTEWRGIAWYLETNLLKWRKSVKLESWTSTVSNTTGADFLRGICCFDSISKMKILLTHLGSLAFDIFILTTFAGLKLGGCIHDWHELWSASYEFAVHAYWDTCAEWQTLTASTILV